MAVRKKRKGMGIKSSVKSGNFRPTKQGAGMTAKGVAAYRRANPGSKLKTAVPLSLCVVIFIRHSSFWGI